MHLHLDVDKVADYNNARTDVKRKSRCIVNTGNNPNVEELRALRDHNERAFGLTKNEIKEMEIPKLPELLYIKNMSATPLEKLKMLHVLLKKVSKNN